ncbi:MAG TPA: SH3 domain-containing protein [Pyrinomonadaceae bacterium]|nr:SH3 domain-containing protein [Pyrinomonadaceae bacterium]
MTKKLLLCLVLLITSFPVLAQEQEGISILPGTVRRATAVRQKPNATQTVIKRLPANATVRVLSPEPRNGFWRVILERGQQGYVLATDLEIAEELMNAAAAGPMAAAASPPCADSLGECEANGCATPTSKRGLFNKAKNHQPTGTNARSLSFADMKSLQNQADEVVEQGTELNQEQRDSLSNFTVTTGKVSEGRLVKLTGFIAKGLDPHPNTGESVNCRLKTPVNNDFHITLALKSSHTEFQGVVVEMIPHNRPDGWTIERLKKVKQKALLVMAIGNLFYDNDHVVNSDPSDNLTGQPKRFSLWEIHPITKFFVCQRANNACAPSVTSHWTKLEDFQ